MSPELKDRAALAAHILSIAEEAGRAIMAVYETAFDTRQKGDASPVTDADESAERIILERLNSAFPVVAEESAAAGKIPEIGAGPFWLVDPLDGTREFISRNGEFTVNIALVEGGFPTLGVVLAPALGVAYWAEGPGRAFRRKGKGGIEPIGVCRPDPAGLVVVASRSHRDARTDAYLAGIKVKDLRSAGSSLKFCLLAEGSADHYPRLGRTMEWDTAAGQAVLAGAGGRVVTFDGAPLAYGKAGFENPDFIAEGG